jgi:hypothetical protein
MWRFGIASVAVLAALGLVAGCQPATSVTVPPASPSASVPESASPEPSFRCTPEAGGDEYDCSQAQHEEMVAKDALYAEAEEVYRRFHAEATRISRTGGVSEPTTELSATASGEFLADAMVFFSDLAERGIRAKGEDPLIASVGRLPGRKKGDSTVAIVVCTDSRLWGYYQGRKRLWQGSLGLDEVYFARADGVLRIVGADGKDGTECDV